MRLGFRFIFVFAVPVGYQRLLSGNPQVIGICMIGRGTRAGEMVSAPRGSEDETTQAACKNNRAESQG